MSLRNRFPALLLLFWTIRKLSYQRQKKGSELKMPLFTTVPQYCWHYHVAIHASMVLRKRGDKGGTGEDASANKKENTGTTASPWLLLLSPCQLCADVSAGLRKRASDRAFLHGKGQMCPSCGDQLVRTCLSLTPMTACSSPQPPPHCCCLTWPHQQHLYTKIWPWLLYGSSRMLIPAFWQFLFSTVPTVHN